MRGVDCTGESPGQVTGRKKTGSWHLRTETKLTCPFPFNVALETGGIVRAAGKGLCAYVQSTILPIKTEFMLVLRATL